MKVIGHDHANKIMADLIRRTMSNDNFFRNLLDQELNNEILWAVAGYLFPDLIL